MNANFYKEMVSDFNQSQTLSVANICGSILHSIHRALEFDKLYPTEDYVPAKWNITEQEEEIRLILKKVYDFIATLKNYKIILKEADLFYDWK